MLYHLTYSNQEAGESNCNEATRTSLSFNLWLTYLRSLSFQRQLQRCLSGKDRGR